MSGVAASGVLIRPGVLPGGDETIAAIATASGRGALAMVRVSGPAAAEISERLLRPVPSAPSAPSAERRATLAWLHHPETGARVDQVMATRYVGPRSFTGEDMLELVTHGGVLAPALVLDAVLAAGARAAHPGEFTRRAMAAGKLDLVQAEAVGDLTSALTRQMHEAALGQLGGALSRRIAVLREAVLGLETLLAYDIDFPEEDEGPVAPERITNGADELIFALDALLATARTGEVVREGAAVVLAGAPNAGKSSLFNALLGRERAIVTEVPGTTRDALEAVLDVGGWPVRLVDTAGLREGADVVERLGVEVSERWLAGADLVLACADAPEGMPPLLARLAGLTAARVLPVHTKADRKSDIVADGYQLAADAAMPAVAVSARSGAGLGALAAAVAGALAESHGELASGAPLLTRERHRRAVERAREEVAAFRSAWTARALPAPVAAVHLRSAAASLEELIGVVSPAEVLERVFEGFCVGK